MRRLSVGRTRRRYAGFRWFVSVPERNLWTQNFGSADFVPLHLATFVQRSALDCIRLHWPIQVRGLFLAATGTHLCFARSKPRHSCPREPAAALDCLRRHSRRHPRVSARDFSSVSPDHQHWPDVQANVAGRHGHDRVDHLCRAHALQRRSRFQLPSRRFSSLASVFHGHGISHADCRLRLLGLLQRGLYRRRNQESGQNYPSRLAAIYFSGGMSIHRNEHQHSGGNSLAGTRRRC